MKATLKKIVFFSSPLRRPPTKGELLRTLHALTPRRSSFKAGACAKTTPVKPPKKPRKERRSQTATRLLRRYFALQVAQITGQAV
ncbi:MAG: hypothetical protein PHV36_07340 [Elusimicrobiales bacterium]|nr:hypothetical protein [Elusimicrobiales bacterium]